MKLSIIIVNYNVRYYLTLCLESVMKAVSGLEAEVIVVDNHSKDDSVSFLQEHFPHVKLISSLTNLGFSRGNNMAIRQSRGEYVLLLNPDTVVGEDALRQAIAFMDEHPGAGGAGVQMLNGDGTKAMESRRALPSPWVSFLKMAGFSKRYYMSHLPWDSPQQIEIVSGAFFLLRRKALDEIGLLDETFFMYGEDIDLSYRLLKGGWTNWYLPLQIIHFKGESTVKSSYRYVHVFYQAMLIFFRKHYGHLSLLLSLPIKTAIYFKAFATLISMQMWRMKRFMGLARESTSQLLIFETATYSYAEMFRLLAGQQEPRALIGIRNSETGILITPNEIIK